MAVRTFARGGAGMVAVGEGVMPPVTPQSLRAGAIQNGVRVPE